VINIKCPVKEVLQHGPEMKESKDWSQLFAGLTERKIKWQPSWQQRSLIIYHCGNYPNVPLIGTRGCINYNPVLAQRQFGYPIKRSPTPYALTTLLISYEDGGATEVLHDIINAWRNIIRMERDSRAWTMNREIPYRQWITKRVEKVKLSFEQISTCLTNEE